jgi:hypothetical protein
MAPQLTHVRTLILLESKAIATVLGKETDLVPIDRLSDDAWNHILDVPNLLRLFHEDIEDL